MLIKIKYILIFKNLSTTVFLNFTTLHVYSSYLQLELFIAIIFYYIKKLLIYIYNSYIYIIYIYNM